MIILKKIQYLLKGKKHRIKYAWNPTYNMIMSIKDKYNKKFNDNNLNFTEWLEKLDEHKFNKIFNHLEKSQNGDLLLIRYGVADMQPSLWTDKNSIFRECRSIVIDIKNENIVIAPFKKFFNLNEVKETEISVIRKKIKKAKVFEITNKLDGSMQCARYYNNNIILTGSRSISRDQSWRIDDGYTMLDNNYKQMIKDNPQLTFIFEYISLKDAHVVNYKKEEQGQYLIGARNVYTGEQLTHNQLTHLAIIYKIKITKKEYKSFEQLLNDMKLYKSNEKEGWVLNVDGQYVKLKCDDYVFAHRILGKYSSVNTIIKNIADGTYDDLISKIPLVHKQKTEQIADKIFEYVITTENEILNAYKLAPKNIKKDFMIWVDKNCDKKIKGYVKSKYLGQSYNVLQNKHGGYRKISELGLTYVDLGIEEEFENNE